SRPDIQRGSSRYATSALSGSRTCPSPGFRLSQGRPATRSSCGCLVSAYIRTGLPSRQDSQSLMRSPWASRQEELSAPFRDKLTGLAPHDNSGIDHEATPIASGVGCSDLTLLAPGAFVGVQKQFALVSHRQAAVRTGSILKLEVPYVPALGATVMGHD